MRVFLVLSIAAMASMPAVAEAPATDGNRAAASSAAPACNDHGTITVAKGTAIGARPLSQEPDAQHIAAVVRTLDGCSRPIVLTNNVGFQKR